ncbi:hypothetical protein, unknown function [Leishmania tarentolae]|uniref:Uncharacterized protein n=1 Tax=Leishmania tarentolae TaxID=5689 RepID=A0A640KHY8_LEITA|nr:hypothetical protein, unknown function [Leishmania tarentolae]
MAAAYVEGHRGRRTFPEKAASQISLGDASSNKPIEEERLARRQARTSASIPWQQQQQIRPTRRPRGPGRAFAAHIEANGFPAAASRRSACVDGMHERLYQYDTSKLHTHKKLAQMPCRLQQCGRSLQLFLRPEEEMARSAAATAMHGELWNGQLSYSRHPSSQAHEHSRDRRMITEAMDGSASPPPCFTPYNYATTTDSRSCRSPAPAATLEESPLVKGSASTDRLRLLEHLYQRELHRLHEAGYSAEKEADAVVEEDSQARHGGGAVSTLPSGMTALPFSEDDSADIAQNVPPPRRRAKRSSVRLDVDSAMYAHPRQGREWQPWECEYACEARPETPRIRSFFHASTQTTVDSDEKSDNHNDRYGSADHAPANSFGNIMYAANRQRASASHPRWITGSYNDTSESTEVCNRSPKHTTRIRSRMGEADAAPRVSQVSSWFAPLRNDRAALLVHRARSADNARASYSLREEKERHTGHPQRHISATSSVAQGSSFSTTAKARPAATSSAGSACTRATVILNDVCTYQLSRAPSQRQPTHEKPPGSEASSPLFSASSACVQEREDTALTLRDVCRALGTSAVMM